MEVVSNGETTMPTTNLSIPAENFLAISVVMWLFGDVYPS